MAFAWDCGQSELPDLRHRRGADAREAGRVRRSGAPGDESTGLHGSRPINGALGWHSRGTAGNRSYPSSGYSATPARARRGGSVAAAPGDESTGLHGSRPMYGVLGWHSRGTAGNRGRPSHPGYSATPTRARRGGSVAAARPAMNRPGYVAPAPSMGLSDGIRVGLRAIGATRPPAPAWRRRARGGEGPSQRRARRLIDRATWLPPHEWGSQMAFAWDCGQSELPDLRHRRGADAREAGRVRRSGARR